MNASGVHVILDNWTKEEDEEEDDSLMFLRSQLKCQIRRGRSSSISGVHNVDVKSRVTKLAAKCTEDDIDK